MNRLVLNTLVAAGIALSAPVAVAQSGAEGMQARHSERHAQDRAFRLPSERVEARIRLDAISRKLGTVPLRKCTGTVPHLILLTKT